MSPRTVRADKSKSRFPSLRRLLGGTAQTPRWRARLTLDRFEDRLAPAVATLASGVLSVDFQGSGAVTVQLSANGSLINAANTNFNTVDVNRIEIFDSLNGVNRSLTINTAATSGTPAINLSGGLSVEDVEDVSIKTQINATGNSSIDVIANRTIVVNGGGSIPSGFAVDAGNITMKANMQAISGTGIFEGINIAFSTIRSNF